jgi:hypothetical protein
MLRPWHPSRSEWSHAVPTHRRVGLCCKGVMPVDGFPVMDLSWTGGSVRLAIKPQAIPQSICRPRCYRDGLSRFEVALFECLGVSIRDFPMYFVLVLRVAVLVLVLVLEDAASSTSTSTSTSTISLSTSTREAENAKLQNYRTGSPTYFEARNMRIRSILFSTLLDGSIAEMLLILFALP